MIPKILITIGTLAFGANIGLLGVVFGLFLAALWWDRSLGSARSPPPT